MCLETKQPTYFKKKKHQNYQLARARVIDYHEYNI